MAALEQVAVLEVASPEEVDVLEVAAYKAAACTCKVVAL